MIIDIVEERKLGGGLSCKRFCIFKSSNHIRISKVTYDVNHFFSYLYNLHYVVLQVFRMDFIA